jgi:hypothetical protein
VEVTSLETLERARVAQGKGRVRKYCGRCGQEYEALANAIPIECENIPCPKCNETQHIVFKVQSLKNIQHASPDEASFEFTVEMSCRRCTKKKEFTAILKKLLSILKIEVKTAGISFRNE